MIELIRAPALSNLIEIDHGFFTRKGGTSEGLYDSLNCALSSKDERPRVLENIRRALGCFNKPLSSFATVKCIHSAKVKLINKSVLQHENQEADAMVTTQKGIVLGLHSADCATIIFADPKNGVVGLAHAGWKGAKLGIIEATLTKMLEQGAETSHISAVIGPCISQDSYEVGMEFYNNFLEDNPDNKRYFKIANRSNHYLFDLRTFNQDHLNSFHLKNISIIEIDTYTDEKRFFSCRRAYHRNEADFGGHLACVYLK